MARPAGKGFFEALHETSGFSGIRACPGARSLPVTTRHEIPLQPGIQLDLLSVVGTAS